jgi:hypothetical protein
MPRLRRNEQPVSERSLRAIGQFARFVSALDGGQLGEAHREQTKLERLGFTVNVRPLGPPDGMEGADRG